MTSSRQPSVLKKKPHGSYYNVLNQQFNLGMGKRIA
jgi:hypothetical protein